MTYETNYYWHIFILTSSELTLGSCTGVGALAVCLSAEAPMGLAFDWPGSTRMPGQCWLNISNPPYSQPRACRMFWGWESMKTRPLWWCIWEKAICTGELATVQVTTRQRWMTPKTKARPQLTKVSFLCSLSSPSSFPNMLAGALCSLTLRSGKHWTRPGCFLDKRKNNTCPEKRCAQPVEFSESCAATIDVNVRLSAPISARYGLLLCRKCWLRPFGYITIRRSPPGNAALLLSGSGPTVM